MPKAQAIDAGHGAFTDHTIARHSKQRLPESTKVWRLRPFSPADAGDRELAIAYLQMYQQTRDERQKNEASRLSGQRFR